MSYFYLLCFLSSLISIIKTVLIILKNGNTSRGHSFIISRKYFPIGSMNRKISGDHNDVYISFALKGKVLEIVKEKYK